jgi:hypothetical protein
MGFLGRVVVVVLALLSLAATPALAADQLQVSIDGRGAVLGGTEAAPDAINCVRSGDGPPTGTCSGSPCLVKCLSVTVQLQPRANKGFEFRGWSGVSCARALDDVCAFSVGFRETVTVNARFVDIAPPLVTLGKLPAAARGPLHLSATATDNVGVTSLAFAVGGVAVPATLSAGEWTATVTPPDGATTVSATAVDAAGNRTTKAADVRIDNSAPSITLSGPADGTVFGPGSTQSWTLAATDAGSDLAGVACSVVPAGAAPVFGPCSAGDHHDVSGLGDGSYTFAVEASDALGNAAQVSRAFVIDATAPVSSIVAGLADGATTTATALSWDFASNEPGVTYACRVYPAALTPGPFAPCSGASSHTAAGFSPGVYAFEVRATDALGNTEEAPVKRTFTVVVPAVLAARPNPTGDGIRILVRLNFGYANSTRKSTKLTHLILKDVPNGSTVTAVCSRSCARKSFKKTKASGTVSLKPLLSKPLKVGARITVTVSKPGAISAVKILKIRPRKSPTITTRCQPEGATKPTTCRAGTN